MMIDDLVAELVEALEELLDDGGGESLERLVEQEHAHVARQRAGDRHHLLLAARQEVGRRIEALADAREIVEDALEIPAHAAPGLAPEAAELEVLGDRHAGEQAAALRHVAETEARDLGRGQPGEIGAVEADLAGRGRRDADQRLQQRRLAGAVAAEQRHDLVLVHGRTTHPPGCGSCRR